MTAKVSHPEATMPVRTFPTLLPPARRALALLLFGWTLACGAAADDTAAPASQPTPSTGSVSLGLAIGPGVRIDSVDYGITRDQFQRAGRLDVRDSTVIAGTISPLPVGAGYALTMSAVDANQTGITCQGDTRFDVLAAQTTPATIHLLCREPHKVVPPGAPVPLSSWARAPLALLLAGIGRACLRRRRRRDGKAAGSS
jgi:hypothetical protein